MLLTFVVFACVAAAALIIFILYNWKWRSGATTVPGLDPSGSNGNLDDISAAGSFHNFLVELHDKFGDVASFWFGPERLCISIASAELFKSTQSLFDRPASLFEFVKPLIGPKSIQYRNGADGKKFYRATSEAFAHKSCTELLPKMNEVCSHLISNWESLAAETHIPLHEYMMALAIKLICNTQMGAYFDNEENTRRLHKLYDSVMNDMDDMMMGDFSKETNPDRYKQFTQNLGNFKTMVGEIGKAYKEQRHLGDYNPAPFLDALLSHSSHDDEELTSNVITFMVAGFHTTGNFLAWALYYLTIYPDLQDRMREEILEVVKDEELREEHFSKLEFTHAFLNEALRATVVAPFAARISEYDIHLGGHLVPAGTPIVHALGVSLSDEKYFSRPGDFDPERFLSQNAKGRPNLAFCPFGFGLRKCPGYKFSYYEAISFIVMVLRKFHLRPAFTNDYHVEQHFGFVTKPETEIWIKVHKRFE